MCLHTDFGTHHTILSSLRSPSFSLSFPTDEADRNRISPLFFGVEICEEGTLLCVRVNVCFLATTL